MIEVLVKCFSIGMSLAIIYRIVRFGWKSLTLLVFWFSWIYGWVIVGLSLLLGWIFEYFGVSIKISTKNQQPKRDISRWNTIIDWQSWLHYKDKQILIWILSQFDENKARKIAEKITEQKVEFDQFLQDLETKEEKLRNLSKLSQGHPVDMIKIQNLKAQKIELEKQLAILEEFVAEEQQAKENSNETISENIEQQNNLKLVGTSKIVI